MMQLPRRHSINMKAAPHVIDIWIYYCGMSINKWDLCAFTDESRGGNFGLDRSASRVDISLLR
jgi:hypothetical protein